MQRPSAYCSHQCHPGQITDSVSMFGPEIGLGATLGAALAGFVVWIKPPAVWRGSIVPRTLGMVYPAKALILLAQLLFGTG